MTDTDAMLQEQSFAASVRRRRYILLLIVFASVYWFIWFPWKASPMYFFIFLGFGMIQTAGTYCQDTGPSRVLDVPPLFMSRIVCLLVMMLGIAGFVVELVIGFHAKPWWEALLLPIPAFILSGLIFMRHNPAPPFFVGIASLFAAFIALLA